MTRPDDYAALSADFQAKGAELLERARAASLLGPSLTLETLVTHPDLGNFTTPSPAQLALMRAMDGRPLGDALSPQQTRYHFGLDALPPLSRPRRVVARTGVRAGKSFIAAMAHLLSILRADFANVRPGEEVRAYMMAPRLGVSTAPFHHLVGTMQASRLLAPMLVRHGAETCTIRRPDGGEVQVRIVAASAGGLNLRSTWVAAALFDEADFHEGEDGAVNLPDNVGAVMARMLPGSQLCIPSSPWADSGPFHEMFSEAFGRPGDTLAFHSDSRSMNPTLSRDDEAAERIRNPQNAAREYDAIPLSTASTLFFPRDAVAGAVNRSRPAVLPVTNAEHFAGVDLGFRKNSSALAIARAEGRRVVVVYHAELEPKPGAPLKPSEVCRLFGQACLDYGCESMRGDAWYADTAREELAKVGGFLGDGVHYAEWQASDANQTAAFTSLRTLMLESRLDLPNDPRLLSQLAHVTSKAMPGGVVKVKLPEQGRAHGDLLMAVVLACMQVTPGEDAAEDEARDEGERYQFGLRDTLTGGQMGDLRRGSVVLNPRRW